MFFQRIRPTASPLQKGCRIPLRDKVVVVFHIYCKAVWFYQNIYTHHHLYPVHHKHDEMIEDFGNMRHILCK